MRNFCRPAFTSTLHLLLTQRAVLIVNLSSFFGEELFRDSDSINGSGRKSHWEFAHQRRFSWIFIERNFERRICRPFAAKSWAGNGRRGGGVRNSEKLALISRNRESTRKVFNAFSNLVWQPSKWTWLAVFCSLRFGNEKQHSASSWCRRFIWTETMELVLLHISIEFETFAMNNCFFFLHRSIVTACVRVVGVQFYSKTMSRFVARILRFRYFILTSKSRAKLFAMWTEIEWLPIALELLSGFYYLNKCLPEIRYIGNWNAVETECRLLSNFDYIEHCPESEYSHEKLSKIVECDWVRNPAVVVWWGQGNFCTCTPTHASTLAHALKFWNMKLIIKLANKYQTNFISAKQTTKRNEQQNSADGKKSHGFGFRHEFRLHSHTCYVTLWHTRPAARTMFSVFIGPSISIISFQTCREQLDICTNLYWRTTTWCQRRCLGFQK